ncbi:Unknown protein sequence [Pseudomonas syringae pv. cilantro]|uniref:Uncharacterized protein n=2 Tax=Pseudomonas syringae group TaxID=136849 RepID=A0A0N0GI80_PSESX|nr:MULTISPECIES: hypothetical protein [Pseudomonas syringae group]KPC36735.1 Unknown protein sequence [Pseudomonas syringae pv. cilantro]KPW75708.1 hypothetical protein ALO76_101899 [Pseudomonas syringae pv. coriandricola]RMN06997.1 hypothetical protein ALQ65_02568 [Pseudomonas syringae pv. coriandricola]
MITILRFIVLPASLNRIIGVLPVVALRMPEGQCLKDRCDD